MAESSYNSRPPRREGDRPFTPRFRTDGGNHGTFRPHPYGRRNEPYVERNDPLPPKDPSEVKVKPSFPELKESDIFTRQQLGGVIVYFLEEDGEAIKAKASHGYLTVKPRGKAPMTGYYRLKSIHGNGELANFPEKRVFTKQLEGSYKLPKDAKLTHVHYSPV